MKCFVLILILVSSALALQWTLSPGQTSTQPGIWTASTSRVLTPPPLGNYWHGIIDPGRAADWTKPGIEGGIPNYSYDCGTIPPSGLIERKINTAYNQGDMIADPRGNIEVATVTGTTDSTARNLNTDWPWQANTTTTDGTMIWNMVTGDNPPGTDTANITNAVIACDGKRGVVTLTAGTYVLTNGIMFHKGWQYPQPQNPPWAPGPVSYVAVHGQGPDKTTLRLPFGGPCSAGDICMLGNAGSQLSYISGNGAAGGGAAWLGTGSTLGTYTKGDSTIIVGAWAGAPAVPGSLLILDQNNDQMGICPTTPPTTDVLYCTVPGATESGGVATIAISAPLPSNYQVGRCVGIGDVGGRQTNINNVNGYNSGGNPDKTTIPDCGLPNLPSWWKITAIGCIVSAAFVDQSACGSNPLTAFQYNTGATGLPVSGGGFSIVDTAGLMGADVAGATMTFSVPAGQAGRFCPSTATAPNPACLTGEISNRQTAEVKVVKNVITGGQGSCPGPVTNTCYELDSPILLPHWRPSQRPGVFWVGPSAVGDGVEGFTYIPFTPSAAQFGNIGGIRFTRAYDGWVRNVRGVFVNRNMVWMTQAARINIEDNYIAGTKGGWSTTYVFEMITAENVLIQNNICQKTVSCIMVQNIVGGVFAYNFMIDSAYVAALDNLMPMFTLLHLQAYMDLYEGNSSPGIQSDNQHGTGGLQTVFRGRTRGADFPYKISNRNGVSSSSFNRGMNFVGNIMGSLPPQEQVRYQALLYSEAVGTQGNGSVYQFGLNKTNTASQGMDPLSSSTLLRWGNYDSITRTSRFCGTGAEAECTCGQAGANANCSQTSEVPTQGATHISPNPIPVGQTLPSSFYLSAQPSFWQMVPPLLTPPWPAIGPDINASGPLDATCNGPNEQCDGLDHHAYRIPAQICFNDMPIDSSVVDDAGRPFQRSFQVTGAVYGFVTNHGNVVTLTVNNDLTPYATNPYSATVIVSGITPPEYNGTFTLHNATPTTMMYWPGYVSPGPYQYGGTVTWPNWREYHSENCYAKYAAVSTLVAKKKVAGKKKKKK